MADNDNLTEPTLEPTPQEPEPGPDTGMVTPPSDDSGTNNEPTEPSEQPPEPEEPPTGVSKVEINGQTVLDLTGDTVQAGGLLRGMTAHAANGQIVEGELDNPNILIVNLTYASFYSESEYDKMDTYKYVDSSETCSNAIEALSNGVTVLLRWYDALYLLKNGWDREHPQRINDLETACICNNYDYDLVFAKTLEDHRDFMIKKVAKSEESESRLYIYDTLDEVDYEKLKPLNTVRVLQCQPSAEPEMEQPSAEPEMEQPSAEPEMEQPSAEPEMVQPPAEPEMVQPPAVAEDNLAIFLENDIYPIDINVIDINTNEAGATVTRYLIKEASGLVTLITETASESSKSYDPINLYRPRYNLSNVRMVTVIGVMNRYDYPEVTDDDKWEYDSDFLKVQSIDISFEEMLDAIDSGMTLLIKNFDAGSGYDDSCVIGLFNDMEINQSNNIRYMSLATLSVFENNVNFTLAYNSQYNSWGIHVWCPNDVVYSSIDVSKYVYRLPNEIQQTTVYISNETHPEDIDAFDFPSDYISEIHNDMNLSSYKFPISISYLRTNVINAHSGEQTTEYLITDVSGKIGKSVASEGPDQDGNDWVTTWENEILYDPPQPAVDSLNTDELKPFVVRFTEDTNQSYNADHTFAEIQEAYSSGRVVYAVENSTFNYQYQLSGIDQNTCYFTRYEMVTNTVNQTLFCVNNNNTITRESHTVQVPDIPDWSKAESKPTYTASEVGALPADTVIPSLDGYATQEWVNQQGFLKTDKDTTYTQGTGITISDSNQISVDLNTITQAVINALPSAEEGEF